MPQPPIQPEEFVFKDDGTFPNSVLPMLIYHYAVATKAADPASAFEQCFAANSWTNSWRDGEDPYALVRDGLEGVRHIAVEKDHVTLKTFESLQALVGVGELADVAGQIRQLRRTKNAAELENLRRAAEVTDRATAQVMDRIRLGQSELAVADMIASAISSAGGTLAFESLVQFGPNSALPHHRPSDRSLQAGDLVLLDFGAAYDGYRADTTRMAVAGDPNPLQKELHRVVLEEAQQLDLHVRRNLGDLVEEHGAALGDLDLPLARAVGVGEGAALVAEQLALDQRLGNRPAVDRHERPVTALAGGVNRVRHQLLAGAVLAHHQHGRVGGRHALDQREHLLDRRGFPDQTVIPLATAGGLRVRGLLDAPIQLGPIARRLLVGLFGNDRLGTRPLPVALGGSLLLRGEDVRTQGSGNIGATNVWRVYGRRLGVPVILLDVAKGFVPALVGLKVSGELTGVLAGAAAMAGHWRPLYLRFTKGGKTVATAGGVTFALAPLAALCCVVTWIAIFLLGRYSSVASIIVALLLPVYIWVFGGDWPVVTFGTLAAVAVLLLHKGNMRRLLAGTESRFHFRRAARA